MNKHKKSLLLFFLIALLIPTQTTPFAFAISPLVWIAGALSATAFALTTRHNNAKNFVEFQKDIAFYSVLIKTKSGKKTICLKTFTTTTPELAIKKTAEYIKTQGSTCWFSIKPKISLMTGETYFLGIITKDKQPRTQHAIAVFEDRLEKKLLQRLIVPVCPNPTYVDKTIGYLSVLPFQFLS